MVRQGLQSPINTRKRTRTLAQVGLPWGQHHHAPSSTAGRSSHSGGRSSVLSSWGGSRDEEGGRGCRVWCGVICRWKMQGRDRTPPSPIVCPSIDQPQIFQPGGQSHRIQSCTTKQQHREEEEEEAEPPGRRAASCCCAAGRRWWSHLLLQRQLLPVMWDARGDETMRRLRQIDRLVRDGSELMGKSIEQRLP